MNHICLDGKMLPADQPVFNADNRGFRYGEGLFETMKLTGGNIRLGNYHFDRLFSGFALMRFEIPGLFTPANITQYIIQLCQKNDCGQQARVRLSVFAGNGGLYEGSRSVHFLIEAGPLPELASQLNENGLVIGIFPDALKSCDAFSNLKSANYLPYAMAARFAKENKWNDCLVQNIHNRIADASIANVFMIRDRTVITPPLHEGCVAGVMRRYLLEKLKSYSGLEVMEQPLYKNDLETADELFLSNAISGIRWVKQFEDKIYNNEKTISIYNKYIKPMHGLTSIEN
jgi:branched-chain amino acid aminotransferase